jgi:hypothetical protein
MTGDLPRDLRDELAKRDELILALEMLVVDQASRLLALEAVVAGLPAVGDVRLDAAKTRIAAGAERFRERFESIGGFTERAQRIAEEIITAA